jgi:hypothetical protein
MTSQEIMKEEKSTENKVRSVFLLLMTFISKEALVVYFILLPV